ncbi:LytTR family DNA-binding domain-containing protein [Flammeovirgaceae bacterium SG7u.111]|nr:LytTR family DNA-binding domain-containing protein [Flammeovirgaceae bacterium SG7u.132]WPO36720.1 LytTR family DNA-binding domain-containing protein [Flammeovirgaceae bacterium SG7u.111]
MLKVLIIEDEKLAADDLEEMLLEINPEIKVLEKIGSVEKAVEWLKSNEEAELIFLDIHLSDGNSFSIFDSVEVKTPIIFTTSYDQYAIKAFKHNSIDYLLKPVDQDELEKAIEKFEELRGKTQDVDLGDILKTISEKKEPEFQQRFMVTIRDSIKSIHVDDVAYFMGEDGYVYLVTKSDGRYIINYTLNKLDTVLDPDKFFRINRKFTVNFDAIQQMTAYSKSRVQLNLLPAPPNELDTIVSVERSGSFKKWLNR